MGQLSCVIVRAEPSFMMSHDDEEEEGDKAKERD
jgi:hypothetical protein